MSEEILINVTPQETRIAVVENGVLQEIYIERTRRRGLVGNIYKGLVSRVLPGMVLIFQGKPGSRALVWRFLPAPPDGYAGRSRS